MGKKNIVISIIAIWLLLNALNLLILFRASESHVERSAALVSAYIGTAGVSVGYSAPLNLLAKLISSDDRFVLTAFSTKTDGRLHSSINLEPSSGFRVSHSVFRDIHFNADIAGLQSSISVAVSDWAICFAIVKSTLFLIGLLSLLKAKFLIDAKRIQLRIAQERYDVANQVAHDIRSPLSAISLVASSVERIDHERGRLLNQSVKRLDQIASDLLASNRPCQYTNNFANILTSLIEERKFTAPGVTFELNIQDSPTLVLNDSVFGRSLSNLVQNALEAGAGNIRISAERIGHSAVIKVSDTGRGMSHEILERAGRKHFSSKNHGNGLGLSFVKDEIEKVGGKVKVSSIVGRGSEIELLIPIKVV